MGRLTLIARLVARDLRHRPAQAVLLLLAVTAATATLALGLSLNGVTGTPYLHTQAVTNGPDVVASGNPAALAALTTAHGVSAHSGPYPVASATLRTDGHTVPVQAEGRDETSAAVDQPEVTQGGWVRPGGVVLERTFARALGVTIGDRVTLNSRSFLVTGLAVTAAVPQYPSVCYYGTCNTSGQYGEDAESSMGLVWVTQADARGLVTQADARGLATRTTPVSYTLNLKLSDPASAPAFAAAHGPRAEVSIGANVLTWHSVLTWQQIESADNDLVAVAQSVLTPGSWLAIALALASVAVLAGGRMAEQTRRVGRLKAAGAAPAMVAAVLLAEHLAVAITAAVAGLVIGWLAAPLLSSAGAGLVGAPGTPALTPGTVGLVVAVALGLTIAATLVPAVRAGRTSTVSALDDAARPPRRRAALIAVSARLPTPLLIGLRIIARRPRRAVLSAASTAVTVTGIVAVIAAHRSYDVTSRHFDWFYGLSDPVSGRVSQVMAVLTVVLVTLAAVNAVITGWSTAMEARQSLALTRALGGTPRQVSVGLAAAQVLPALPGAIIGIPLGIALFALANGSGIMTVPPFGWLVAVVLGTLAAAAALTAIPAARPPPSSSDPARRDSARG